MGEVEELRVRVSDVEKSYIEVARLVAMREEHSKNVSDKVDKIYDLLIGTGEDDSPGLKIKVDRLEIGQKVAAEHRAILYAGVVALGFNALWEWLKHGSHGG